MKATKLEMVVRLKEYHQGNNLGHYWVSILNHFFRKLS